MRLLIEKKDLELLLEKNRDFIGNEIAIDTIIAAISFLLSVCTATYKDILGISESAVVIKTIFCMIGIFYAGKVSVKTYQHHRHKYDHNTLCKDIEYLNMIQHNHSLVVIKDSFATEKRYLLYYDEKWDCKLFLNYKTLDRNNESALVDHVAADLQIDKNQITYRYRTSRVQEKYSVSHQENRVYNHRLYEININNFPEKEKKDDFVVNERHYYWMSIADMERDKNIIEKNLEVVDFVKEVME